MAILFGFWGLSVGNPFLLLIALFVWIGAEAEARQVEERIALRGVPVRAAMLTDYRTLAPDDTLGHAAELLLAGSQHDFPVVADGRPGVVLTRDDLLAGLAQVGREGRVGSLSLRDLARVEAEAPLVPALALLREGGEPCLQVVEDGRPVGLLTLENVAEFVLVRAALAASAPGR
jgi:CBS domain-containing protein